MGTPGRLHFYSPPGAYIDTTNDSPGNFGVFVDDPDFIATNIKAGTNIYGIQGSSTVVDTADAVLDPMPAVLIEYGFMDDAKDAAILKDTGAVESLAYSPRKGLPRPLGSRLNKSYRSHQHLQRRMTFPDIGQRKRFAKLLLMARW
jgi:hypothetical protein